ncbi:hypothetical protein SLEP1_g8703 [Rubroshorea leprosula]|uniref:Uncharacterized protein n=1 Tax=Rubroshorea leprosula TaxID=152421 RepID=A0AAV5I2I8_9ROSI|nr:hypothetical protein SLEP1_g8703 [Rubroshorea leprosula]
MATFLENLCSDLACHFILYIIINKFVLSLLNFNLCASHNHRNSFTNKRLHESMHYCGPIMGIFTSH